MRPLRAILGGLAAAVGLGLAHGAAAVPLTVLSVQPSALDPAVRQFDDPSVVVLPDGAKPTTPVVLFLTGTGGKPSYSLDFQKVVAGQGYRVIALTYDDEPAVSQVCPRDPDPACSSDFREMRTWGDGPSKAVSNPVAESIDARLTTLLNALNRRRPGDGWSAFVKDGHPDWSRFVVSGLSQGAGMAAYIAKKHEVARVVLFSSPWDWTGPQRSPAPWLGTPTATPMERWYAEYHARENTAPAIQRAYAVLGIPPDHIRVFNRDLPDRFPQASRSPNPFHGMTIRDTGYADDWRAMFGKPD